MFHAWLVKDIHMQGYVHVCFAFLLANMLSEVQVCMLCTLYTAPSKIPGYTPLNCITENDIQESKMYRQMYATPF